MRFLLTTWRHWQRLVDGLCKQCTATAECVNAQTRNRRLLRTPVRGLAKVRCMLGLFVLAHNLMRMAKLALTLSAGG